MGWFETRTPDVGTVQQATPQHSDWLQMDPLLLYTYERIWDALTRREEEHGGGEKEDNLFKPHWCDHVTRGEQGHGPVCRQRSPTYAVLAGHRRETYNARPLVAAPVIVTNQCP
eukprot:4792223-Pyramimonas_sp.AAC.2